jgi:hypothetical protein
MNIVKQHWFWIVIIALILIVIFVMVWLWPESKAVGGGISTPAHPDALKGLSLSHSQQEKLLPILEAEDHDIDVITMDSDIKAKDKPARIKAVHEADEAKLKQILTPDQYQKLMKLEKQNGGKALSQ